MNVTDLIILILVVIDVVSLSMVTFIFRWARNAMVHFRLQIMDLLSGESEESVQIIEKLGHAIYQKLYRYFNLGGPEGKANISLNIPDSVSGESQSGLGIPVNAAAKAMGITDPGFLKYLPLIEKYLLSKKGNEPSQSVNTLNDSW